MPGTAAQDQRRGAPIDPIAQTILQLFDQLRGLGYGADELYLVRRAHDLAASLSACQYRGSGRSLLEHLLGTASVIASLGGGAELVAATVAHAAYVHGDFGTLRKRLTEKQRKRVRDAIGGAAEEIVHRYSTLYWGARTIPALRARLSSLAPVDREALTIRLGDQLDIYGTRETLYCDNLEQRRAFARDVGPSVVVMADEMGYPQLAAALRLAYAETLERAVADALQRPAWRDGLIVPRSYRIRPSIALYRRVRSRVWRWVGR